MTKRNFFSRLALAMMMTVAFTGFTSCGNDNDDNDNDEPDAPVTLTSSYIVAFELGDDVMNTADITAHIANPDGTLREEKVTKNKLSWTLTGDKLPDKAAVLLTFVPKKNIDETKVYNISIKGSMSATCLRGTGVVDATSNSNNFTIPIKGDKLAQYYTGSGVGFAYGIGADGKITRLDVDSFDFGLNGLWEWIAGWLKDEEAK